MIRINLLPQEFRRRSGPSINQDALIVVAGVVVVLLVGAFWAWLHFVRIPYAEDREQELAAEKRGLEAQVKQLEEMERQIAQIQRRIDVLDSLRAQKVEWARTMWDFAELFGRDGNWGEQFQVSCRNLRVQQGRGGGGRGAAATTNVWNFDFTFELVGRQREKAGDYLKAFWQGISNSRFWQTHDFLGQPEDSYRGDHFQWNAAIERTVLTMDLQFQRQGAGAAGRGR